MSAVWWFLWAEVTVVCGLAGWLAGVLARASAKAMNTEDRLAAFIDAGPYLKLAGGTISGNLHVAGVLYGAGGTLDIGDAVSQSGGNITSGGTNVTGASSWVNASCYPSIGYNLDDLSHFRQVSQPGQIGSAPATYQQSSDQTFRVLTNDISSQLVNAGVFV